MVLAAVPGSTGGTRSMTPTLPLSAEVGHWAHRPCARRGSSQVLYWRFSATAHVSVECGKSNREGERSGLNQSRGRQLPLGGGVGTRDGGVPEGDRTIWRDTVPRPGTEDPACSGASPCCFPATSRLWASARVAISVHVKGERPRSRLPVCDRSASELCLANPSQGSMSILPVYWPKPLPCWDANHHASILAVLILLNIKHARLSRGCGTWCLATGYIKHVTVETVFTLFRGPGTKGDVNKVVKMWNIQMHI